MLNTMAVLSVKSLRNANALQLKNINKLCTHSRILPFVETGQNYAKRFAPMNDAS